MDQDSAQKQKKKREQKWAAVSAIIGLVVFELLRPYLFETTPDRINYVQVFWAAVVGGQSAVLGVGFSRYLDMIRD